MHSFQQLRKSQPPCQTALQRNKQKIAGLISSLQSTMGNQGPTNPQFNGQVQTLQKTLLPKIVENWDTLNEDNKKEIANMGNFFCKIRDANLQKPKTVL